MNYIQRETAPQSIATFPGGTLGLFVLNTGYAIALANEVGPYRELEGWTVKNYVEGQNPTKDELDKYWAWGRVAFAPQHSDWDYPEDDYEPWDPYEYDHKRQELAENFWKP